MPGAYASPGAGKGFLQVFSATRPVNDGGVIYYLHTAYSVYGADGKRAASCANHAGQDDQVPLVLMLSAGRYEVYADAEGVGRVRVPVVVERGRLTVVFLEREGMPRTQEAVMLGRPVVRGPDGRVIGAAPEEK